MSAAQRSRARIVWFLQSNREACCWVLVAQGTNFKERIRPPQRMNREMGMSSLCFLSCAGGKDGKVQEKRPHPHLQGLCVSDHTGTSMLALRTPTSQGLCLGEAERMGPGIVSHVFFIHTALDFHWAFEHWGVSMVQKVLASNRQQWAALSPSVLNFLGVPNVTCCFLSPQVSPTLRDRPGLSWMTPSLLLDPRRRDPRKEQSLGAFSLRGEGNEEWIQQDPR